MTNINAVSNTSDEKAIPSINVEAIEQNPVSYFLENYIDRNRAYMSEKEFDGTIHRRNFSRFDTEMEEEKKASLIDFYQKLETAGMGSEKSLELMVKYIQDNFYGTLHGAHGDIWSSAEPVHALFADYLEGRVTELGGQVNSYEDEGVLVVGDIIFPTDARQKLEEDTSQLYMDIDPESKKITVEKQLDTGDELKEAPEEFKGIITDFFDKVYRKYLEQANILEHQ